MPQPADSPPRKVIIGTMMHAMWEDYPGLDARLSTLSGFVDRMAAEAEREYNAGLDLAILPEYAVTGELENGPDRIAFPLEGKVLDVMGAVARTHHTYLIVPMILRETAEGDVLTNAAVLLDRGGKPVGIYRKVHVVSTEPGAPLEGGGAAPGKDFPVFRCDFGKIGIQICYDMTFEDGWATLARKGAEIVVWPSQSPQIVQPAARARQNGYYIISCTWRNNASIFDPTGHTIAQTTEPSSVLVEQIDLSYALIDWQPALHEGEAFARKYGEAVGYRYSEAEDGGIFWSNDPKMPIMRMVRELGMELRADSIERNRRLQDEARGGPPSTD